MQEGRRVSASLPIDAAKESNPVTSSYETAVASKCIKEKIRWSQEFWQAYSDAERELQTKS